MKNTYFRRILLIILAILMGFLLNSNVRTLHKNNLELKEQIEEQSNEIDSINEHKERVIEEKDSIKNEKDSIEKEKQNLEQKYKELNDKYQKELEPVSYNSSNLLSLSNATISKLRVGLKGTGLEGLESSYLEAESTYGINAIFLVALTAEESGWGKSNRARTQNNLSGHAVYSASATGTTFGSKHESIMATAKLIKEDYLSVNGKYYNGVSAYSVNLRYCPDDGANWSNNITTIADELVGKINSR